MVSLSALLAFVAGAFHWLLAVLFGVQPKRVRNDAGYRPQAPARSPLRSDTDDKTPLEDRAAVRHHLQTIAATGKGLGKEDVDVADSFLAQLEQRTQQVKITLANLEAQKVRIEGMIAQLQPIVPHYDALLAAERQLSETQIALDQPESSEPQPQVSEQPAGQPRPQAWEQNQPQEQSWEEQHQPEASSGGEGWSGSWNT